MHIGTPVDMLLVDESLKEEYMDAILIEIFHIGTNVYAVIQKSECRSLAILKIVSENGSEELHEIDSDAEFQSVLETYHALFTK